MEEPDAGALCKNVIEYAPPLTGSLVARHAHQASVSDGRRDARTTAAVLR
jgi:hypothetical protein